ncbi:MULTISPECIES: DUF2285 domain-containing protein [Caulobacter]|jgi:hypothetical protein|uniref:DUF2285 domain-containing protein n=1 Tax=Caulobacter TaxID=75 RepID=UPI001E3A30DC|nr:MULTISPECIES: DUF2285 domain-containing protein [Caulobacter]
MATVSAPSAAGRPPGGGAGGGWRRLIDLSAPAFAWEFLRRNPGYQDDWRRERGFVASAIDPRWGLRFAADPALPADEAEVFWRGDVAPGIVLPMAVTEGASPRSRPRRWPSGVFRRADDGLHVRLSEHLQLILPKEARGDEPLSVLLAYDADLGLRVRAVDALERFSRGRPPPGSRLSAAQRARLARSVVALDGALRGQSYRAIADDLFGTERLDAEAWRTASLRGVTIRLVRAGKALMNGGYLDLLRRGL